MKECVIIPARYNSKRFPGKPLVKLLGKEMIVHVAEIAKSAVGLENVYIATDDKRIADLVSSKGYKFVMTSENALTGTDRVAEASKMLNYDIFVNVQGDEPLVSPEDIKKCISYKIKYPEFIINSYNLINNNLEPSSLNIPKVVVNESDFLIYISRSLIPGYKDHIYRTKEYKKQVCIYAYNKDELKSFLRFGRKSILESHEDIELLRFFELGYQIKMFRSNNYSLAVDIPGDIPLVERKIKLRDR